jgi:sialidase-1
MILLTSNSIHAEQPYVAVLEGKGVDVFTIGADWSNSGTALQQSGEGNTIYAGQGVEEGDFRVRARLSIEDLNGSVASFEFDRDRFGFDGGRKSHLFVEGATFGDPHFVASAADFITPGTLFDFEVVRKGEYLVFKINDKEIWRSRYHQRPIRFIGLRPWRNTMKIESFTIQGSTKNLPQYLPLFKGGEDDYRFYRKPVLLHASSGALLAFAEARATSRHDLADSDLVLKRSHDNGKTWSDLQVVVSDKDDTPASYGTICPVQEKNTGRIFLFYTLDQTCIFVQWSDDDGRSWHNTREVTSILKNAKWSSVITGPGTGIQLERGKHAGRLIVPAAHMEPANEVNVRRAHTFYSDDQGATWQVGKVVGDHTWENQAVELDGDRVLMTIRNHHYIDGGDDAKRGIRAVSISLDGAETWGLLRFNTTLIDPRCQASIVRAVWPDGGQPGLLLFCNPADRDMRHWLTLRHSTDEGNKWSDGFPIYPDGSYSSLAVAKAGSVDCLFETGNNVLYTRLPLNQVKMVEEEPPIK